MEILQQMNKTQSKTSRTSSNLEDNEGCFMTRVDDMDTLICQVL